jgi:hypothetical protein
MPVTGRWAMALSYARAHAVPVDAPVRDHAGRSIATGLCGYPGLVDEAGLIAGRTPLALPRLRTRSRRKAADTGQFQIAELVRRLPKRAWQRLSAGKGAKGHRFYDWAWIRLAGGHDEPFGHRWLLVRRHRRTGELAFYRCYAPGQVPLAVLVRVAGRRWTVEESFQTSKGQTGLDEYQCRTWRSWYRWTTLVLLAHAFLAFVTAIARSCPTPAGLIPLTLNEIRYLYNALVVAPVARVQHVLRCSFWRRAISTALSKPTTSDNRSKNHEDHEVRLEY